MRINKVSIGKTLYWTVALFFAAAAFAIVRYATLCWTLSPLAGVAPASCGEDASAAPAPFDLSGEDTSPTALPSSVSELPPVPEAALPDPWDGGSRVNILFIGLDYRDWEASDGPPRSDTMILFTIDPMSMTAGMLSIPRDLWVNIPEYGYSRINTAYSFGEGARLPGGGPGLAMKTVENLLGVPVHYYAQVDFNTFITIVNRVGCIYVTPTERLVLDPIGPGMDKVVIKPGGERKLCGWKALAYARTRKSEGGDFDRSMRQQQVIFALRDRIFDPEVFPTLIAQAPALYNELQSGIHTNLPLQDALRLAVLAKDIPPDKIKAGVIDPKLNMADFQTAILDGQNASIMRPMMDNIRILRDEIFTVTGPASPLAVGDPAALMRDESAPVRVMDGTYTPGFDQRAGLYFRSFGMNVTEVAPPPEAYAQTVLVVYQPSLYAVRWMQSAFGIPDRNVIFRPDPASPVALEIRLGTDILANIP